MKKKKDSVTITHLKTYRNYFHTLRDHSFTFTNWDMIQEAIFKFQSKHFSIHDSQKLHLDISVYISKDH